MRKSSNKILLIILIALVAGFVGTRLLRAPSRERNIAETLLTIDTSKVRAIHISPAVQKGMEIRLTRSDRHWQIQGGKLRGHPEIAQVKNVLGSLTSIRADRILTRKKESWGRYHVDTTGTYVKVLLGQNDEKEFWLGKLDNSGTSIRLEGDIDVYATKGSLEGTFNRNFNEWRDKAFVKIPPETISRITFQYPGDSSFVLARKGNLWEVGNVAADSSKVQTFLNRFRNRSLQQFSDDFTPSTDPAFTVTLHGDGTTTTTIQSWNVGNDLWVLNSSQYKDVYFSSNKEAMIHEIFVGRKWFLTK